MSTYGRGHYNGQWEPWNIKVRQVSSDQGPSGYTTNGSRFTVVDGVFYGHFLMRIPSTSDFGAVTGEHYEFRLTYPVETQDTGDYGIHLLGNGYIWREGTDPYYGANVRIETYYNLDATAALTPTLPYWNETRHTTNDPDNLYEPWNWWRGRVQDTAAQTETSVHGVKAAWQAIATDFGRESTASLRICAYVKYIIKQR